MAGEYDDIAERVLANMVTTTTTPYPTLVPIGGRTDPMPTIRSPITDAAPLSGRS